MRCTRSLSLKSKAITPGMRAHTRWEREFIKKKKVEIAKLRKFVKEEVGFFFFLFTCKHSRSQYGHDQGACAPSGKSPENEPFFCHFINYRQHGEHVTQEAGAENGKACEDVANQDRLGLLLPNKPHGVRCLPLLRLSPKGWDT